MQGELGASWDNISLEDNFIAFFFLHLILESVSKTSGMFLLICACCVRQKVVSEGCFCGSDVTQFCLELLQGW